jgi:hypothetical protein
MHTFRKSPRKQALLATLVGLVAAAALLVLTTAHADARAKQLKYTGASTTAPSTKLILEGPEGKKGAWPWTVTPTLTNATATCPVEPGVEAPYTFTERFSEFPVPVSLSSGNAHATLPTINRREQFTAGSETEEGDYAVTETWFSGLLAKNGKKGHLTVKYSFTVDPSAIGSKEAEPVCHYEGSFTFTRVR